MKSDKAYIKNKCTRCINKYNNQDLCNITRTFNGEYKCINEHLLKSIGEQKLGNKYYPVCSNIELEKVMRGNKNTIIYIRAQHIILSKCNIEYAKASNIRLVDYMTNEIIVDKEASMNGNCSSNKN